ncbi:MAG: DUF5666 domain-containing protein [Chloroflexota bacterium]
MIQEPVQPTLHETPPARRGSRRGLLGLVAVGCLALAVPIVGIIAAGSHPPLSPAGASAAPAPAAAESEEPGDGNGNGFGNGDGNRHGAGKGLKGLKGLKGNGGAGHGLITISAIAGSQVSLRTEDGWSRTITVTSGTVITKAGKTIAVGDLKVGDAVHFHQVRNADGTYAVDAIAVPTPVVGGEVTAVDGNNVTVTAHGATRVITVDGSTVYKLGSGQGAKSDVKVGSEIEAQGSLTGDTFLAATLAIELPHQSGAVTAKTATTITITGSDGKPATIHVTGATTYRVKGKAAASLADIAVGDRITATGDLRADGSLDAVAVGTHGAKDHGDDQGNDDGDELEQGAAASPAPG